MRFSPLRRLVRTSSLPSSLPSSAPINKMAGLIPSTIPKTGDIMESASQNGYTAEILSQDEKFHNWMTLYEHTVQFTNRTTGHTKTLAYDIVGHKRNDFSYVMVFPFMPANKDWPASVYLIKEYFQGWHSMALTLPTGAYDPKKHRDMAHAAEAELSEETGLRGRIVPLLPEGHPGMRETKWCLNRGFCFLGLDLVEDPDPGAKDAEEFTIEVVRTPLRELRKVLYDGAVSPGAIIVAGMAVDYLKGAGLISADDWPETVASGQRPQHES